MTPSQFIESRRVEGGLMGGVFPVFANKPHSVLVAEMEAIRDAGLMSPFDEEMIFGNGTIGWEGIGKAIGILNSKPLYEPSGFIVHPDDYALCVKEAARRGVSVDVVLAALFGVPA